MERRREGEEHKASSSDIEPKELLRATISQSEPSAVARNLPSAPALVNEDFHSPTATHTAPRAGAENDHVYPTTSQLTLTEDNSLVGSGSPLTVAKAAAILRLQQLTAQSALSFDEDQFSTLGSEYSTLPRMSSTPSKSLAGTHA